MQDAGCSKKGKATAPKAVAFPGFPIYVALLAFSPGSTARIRGAFVFLSVARSGFGNTGSVAAVPVGSRLPRARGVGALTRVPAAAHGAGASPEKPVMDSTGTPLPSSLASCCVGSREVQANRRNSITWARRNGRLSPRVFTIILSNWNRPRWTSKEPGPAPTRALQRVSKGVAVGFPGNSRHRRASNGCRGRPQRPPGSPQAAFLRLPQLVSNRIPVSAFPQVRRGSDRHSGGKRRNTTLLGEAPLRSWFWEAATAGMVCPYLMSGEGCPTLVKPRRHPPRRTTRRSPPRP